MTPSGKRPRVGGRTFIADTPFHHAPGEQRLSARVNARCTQWLRVRGTSRQENRSEFTAMGASPHLDQLHDEVHWARGRSPVDSPVSIAQG